MMSRETLKETLLIGLLVLSVFSFASCSSNRLDKLEKRTNNDISDLRGIQADHTAAINSIRNELRELAGKIEEIQYTSSGKTKELERTIQRLGARVPPPSGVPEDLLARDEERISTLSGPAADLFKRALEQLRQGEIDGARNSFSRFAEENPGTAFTDNALFWLGMCYTKQGQYDRAIVSFSDVFQSYPAEDMVAPALYYLAQTFLNNGATDDAVLTLQKLIEEHPKTNWALKAQQQVKELRPEKKKPAGGTPASSGKRQKR